MTGDNADGDGADSATLRLARTDLRKYVEIRIREAIRGIITDESSDPEYIKQNVNLWIQILTDQILTGFRDFLPERKDIFGKYEVSEGSGIHVQLSDTGNETRDSYQLNLLADYASDEGYNRCRKDILAKLQRLYNAKEIPL
jgi:hypothetical protein